MGHRCANAKVRLTWFSNWPNGRTDREMHYPQEVPVHECGIHPHSLPFLSSSPSCLRRGPSTYGDVKESPKDLLPEVAVTVFPARPALPVSPKTLNPLAQPSTALDAPPRQSPVEWARRRRADKE